eukprot:4058589-Prymnesium_polylepis.1
MRSPIAPTHLRRSVCVRCDDLRSPGSTPPSPLTAKPGAGRWLGSTHIPYLSTLGTGGGTWTGLEAAREAPREPVVVRGQRPVLAGEGPMVPSLWA